MALIVNAIGAAVAVLAIIFGLHRRGSGWMVRSFRQGEHLRACLVTVAGACLALNIVAFTIRLTDPARVAIGLIPLAISVVALALLSKPRCNGQPKTHKVLAVGAHPDDLELACGATLAKLADTGYEVHCLIMSHGHVGGDASTRPDEAKSGAEFMRLASMTLLDFTDTRLAEHSNDMVNAIEERINEIEPELIFTHSEHDQHQDHHAVHLATLRAGRKRSSILCFESPSVTRAFNPHVFVDVSDYVDIKVRAIAMHANQMGKPYMGAERIRGMAAFRGSQAKCDSAEGFEAVRLTLTPQ